MFVNYKADAIYKKADATSGQNARLLFAALLLLFFYNFYPRLLLLRTSQCWQNKILHKLPSIMVKYCTSGVNKIYTSINQGFVRIL